MGTSLRRIILIKTNIIGNVLFLFENLTGNIHYVSYFSKIFRRLCAIFMYFDKMYKKMRLPIDSHVKALKFDSV